jgi:hypothetical protein
MTIKETTIDEIIESEKIMLLEWEKDFWEFYTHAFDVNGLLNNFFKSILKPDYFIFISFLSQIKKHLTLALFSYLRQHHVQGWMNIRQSLESISWSIYALWNNEEEKFCIKTETWWLDIPERLWKARNIWITDNFPKESKIIKDLKGLINNSVAHSNIVYTFQNFDPNYIGKWIFKIPFFDIYDDYKIKNDLWFVSNVTIWFLDLLYWANKKFKIIKFENDFLEKLRNLWNQNEKLKQELMSSDRFIDSKNTNQ